jgi:RNA polymerase sigma-70 factor (ECF subfamily)
LATKSDKELIKQFLAGDQHAFNSFVQRHQDRIYRLACAKLYASDDAVDAAQEVFLRAFKGFKFFRFQAEPFTWLYKTLENVCNEFNRRATRDRKLNQHLVEQTTEHTVPDGAENIHMQQVRQLTQQLPKRQQEVVLLRIFEGMSVEETAKTLKCSEGTIKANLHKAVNNMRGYAKGMDFLDHLNDGMNDNE